MVINRDCLDYDLYIYACMDLKVTWPQFFLSEVCVQVSLRPMSHLKAK